MAVPEPGGAGAVRLPRAARALRLLLGIPLGAKLVGANMLIAAAAVGVALGRPGGYAAGGPGSIVLVLAALFATLACNLALVALALRPLNVLEHTAARVWRGDLTARVPASPLADADMARLGQAFNLMLDGLARDRARIADLVAEVIRAESAERTRLGGELQESAAQTLAAAVYQLSSARHALAPVDGAPADPARALAGLDAAHRLAADALDEVQAFARGMRAGARVHPSQPPRVP